VTVIVERQYASEPRGFLESCAIHVASAGLLRSEMVALVTYDHRMADAARGAGLPVSMPGLE